MSFFGGEQPWGLEYRDASSKPIFGKPCRTRHADADFWQGKKARLPCKFASLKGSVALNPLVRGLTRSSRLPDPLDLARPDIANRSYGLPDRSVADFEPVPCTVSRFQQIWCRFGWSLAFCLHIDRGTCLSGLPRGPGRFLSLVNFLARR